jgi:adenylate cyclase class IV
VESTLVYRYDVNPTREQIAELTATHKEIGTIEKERKIYTLGNVKIHLDKTKDGKAFVEIEAIDREGTRSRELLRRQCLEVKTKLGIQDNDLINTGYWTSSLTVIHASFLCLSDFRHHFAHGLIQTIDFS